ncbi:DUF4232 domain-containing protein [Streptomyces turgidiscabies]|uniref:Putative lipoprotein n=1 Tax=Streptomyces turgidiscabies (strain Car8) TaxID=698760 RepID=L7EUS1_STRT8|nr:MULTISPECIES: DUF4232 domain-containing protein [Streptomyces]ELP63153.1 putative lipoprotein [Streptomyces turgidiscabies Car8]MDX3495004.1 DUF4232 domain-containing protein [Streptomyces turgidiscabies]GAQ70876.1 hypothetical protein T45_02617 [Streptomyces turgidiscabies]
MRTTYDSWKACAVGAAALTALLSVTACDSKGTDNGAGTTPSVPAATAPLSASPSTTASTRPSTTGGEATTISTSTPAAVTAGAAVTATCGEANISIATTLYAHDSARHLLLTATNTGGKKCALYRYPVVRFDEGGVDQVGPMESEMKTVTIGPGEKAYAGMLLFREGLPTEAVERVTVSLQGRVSNADPDSAPIKAPLPAEATFLNIDDNPLVSYWNASRQKAEKYMFGAAGGN